MKAKTTRRRKSQPGDGVLHFLQHVAAGHPEALADARRDLAAIRASARDCRTSDPAEAERLDGLARLLRRCVEVGTRKRCGTCWEEMPAMVRPLEDGCPSCSPTCPSCGQSPPLRKDLEPLRAKLLGIAGATTDGTWKFNVEINERLAHALLTEGKLLDGRLARVVPGRANDCHTNAAKLAAENSRYVRWTGFALSDEREHDAPDWVSHSWCMSKKGAMVVETTTPRRLYFGVPA